MEIVEFRTLTARRQRELQGDEEDPFDGAGSAIVYGSKERWVGAQDADGRLVAAAGLTVSGVQVGDVRFPAVGIGGVIVTAAHRGRGHARTVMRRALAIAGTMGPEFALLFCRADRAGLYAKLGFAPVARDVVVRQPGDPVVMPLRTMWRGLRDGARWPDGAVIVHGLPF